MTWGRPSRKRQVSAALALIALVFQATVLQWHVASRFGAQLLDFELRAQYGFICHGGNAGLAATPSGDGNSGLPGEPASDCPICKVLAGIQLATVDPIHFAGVERIAVPVYRAPGCDTIAAGVKQVVRNRGPPALA